MATHPIDDYYAFREAMVEALATDLLGPGSEDEVLDESPLDRYVTGVLYPAGRSENTDEADDAEDAADGTKVDGGADPGVALARMKHPSSMGLSFGVDVSTADAVTVVVDAACYTQSENSAVNAEVSPELDVRSRAQRRRAGEDWQRVPVTNRRAHIAVTTPGVTTVEVEPGLELFCVVREPSGDVAPVTVVLRNTTSVPQYELRDPYCWFQPHITVTTDPPALTDRRVLHQSPVSDEDLDSYELLFRDTRSFAVGHGCAVQWPDTTDPMVGSIETTFLPSYEVPLSTPRPASADADLDMASLSQRSPDDMAQALRPLVDDYLDWIAQRDEEIPALDPALRPTAQRHLDAARTAADRMQRGIDLLARGGPEFEAFRLMNAAMQEQRSRQDWIRAGTPTPAPTGTAQVWRPFQIAFILLNLSGLADPEHDDRRLADLLWFPTGGGKTEAYLGLIAFVILLRRLRDSGDRGVAVIMRYTLRLLTLQQFERAATLICALESIRRNDTSLRGGEPIGLGLWVGQGATPNTIKDARQALSRLRAGAEPTTGNPMQLTRCPWCGTPLVVDNYRIDPKQNHLVIACGVADCDFGNGLPLHVVDEDVYRYRPSLLIGTVDKFALMPWREQARTIFSSDGAGRPPDLIVQDELHLISGPLGTLVGLYEVAVDAAAGRLASPKVIASTATIRRAGTQMRAVFDREAFQFPPPGLDMTDSFFAVQADRHEKGTRRYVGLLAPGTSQTTLLVRTYAALLQAATEIPGADEVRDPYWTLIGYFNSLRVLGGAFMQVIDDVPDRVRLLASRHGQPERPVGTPDELTSRVNSSEIPLALARLADSYPDPNSPDVVLATNMISVGVDVDRLGLMAVMGQPQATAEYIQSTSRIGRQHPGLAVVMYNAARSRDRSHYENFHGYHETLYREVEATSATPFALRARDRGLHGVLVSMARLLLDDAAADDAAGSVASFSDRLEQVAAVIVERARRIDPDEADATEQQLSELIECWVHDAGAKRPMKYSSWKQKASSLLIEAGEALTSPAVTPDTDETPWPTLLSLRDVDAETSLYLVPNYEGRST